MTARWGWALAIAVALLGAWIASKTYWGESVVHDPPKGEALTNRYYAAQQLLRRLGARVEPAGELLQLPPNDATLMLNNFQWSLIKPRRERLKRWVEAGGHLVVDDVAADDADFVAWTGLEWHDKPEPEDAEDEDTEPAPPAARVAPKCPRYAVHAGTDSPAGLVTCGAHDWGWVSSKRPVQWGMRYEQGWLAARVALGRGTVTRIDCDCFDNEQILEHDNALLLVYATQARAGLRMRFISETEATPLLTLMWRYGAPVILLAALALAVALWRGALRFGPLVAVPALARRSLAEQIRGSAHFALRFGAGAALHAAAERALHEAARQHIAGYRNLSATARLNAIAARSGIAAARLQAALQPAPNARRTHLLQALACLEQARRRIHDPLTEGPSHAK